MILSDTVYFKFR